MRPALLPQLKSFPERLAACSLDGTAPLFVYAQHKVPPPAALPALMSLAIAPAQNSAVHGRCFPAGPKPCPTRCRQAALRL